MLSLSVDQALDLGPGRRRRARHRDCDCRQLSPGNPRREQRRARLRHAPRRDGARHLGAQRLSAVRHALRRRRFADYATEAAFPGGQGMRGAAREDLPIPPDMRAPPALRPYGDGSEATSTVRRLRHCATRCNPPGGSRRVPSLRSLARSPAEWPGGATMQSISAIRARGPSQALALRQRPSVRRAGTTRTSILARPSVRSPACSATLLLLGLGGAALARGGRPDARRRRADRPRRRRLLPPVTRRWA